MAKKGVTMLMIDQPAPRFTAPAVFDDGEVKTIHLDDYNGKWVVLFFYPLDFTFVCPTELTQFRDLLESFKAAGAQLIGCSIDSVYSHTRWLKDDLGNLGYPLIGDITKRVCRDYGVLIEEKGIATRGTFIIDPEGRTQYMGVHNLNVGRDAKEIHRVLLALQSGELCAAGWKKGDSFVNSK
jgi:peroxiredoxin (alkyl hydroperoxide reductase subunit C)